MLRSVPSALGRTTLNDLRGTRGMENGVVKTTGRSLWRIGIEEQAGFLKRSLPSAELCPGILDLTWGQSRTDASRMS